MLIIVDKKLPGPAKALLSYSGQLIELETFGITYKAISGHPDIFFFQIDDLLIVAPNLPENYKSKLRSLGVTFSEGSKAVGATYPESAIYNAVATSRFFVHNLSITDPSVLSFAGDKIKINVKQGYTRCNLVFLAPDRAISSDMGICKKLSEASVKVLFFDPKSILLQGFDHGFIGGCCGVSDNKLWISGTLNYHRDGQNLRDFATDAGFEIIELNDGPLFDAGSIFFVNIP